MKRIFVFTILFFFVFCVQSQSSSPGWIVKDPFEPKLFIENKGQFKLPEEANNRDSILYGAKQDGLCYYITNNSIWIKYVSSAKRSKRERERVKERYFKGLAQTKEEEDILNEGEGEEGEEDKEFAYKLVNKLFQIKFTGAELSTTIHPEEKVSQLFNYSIGTTNIQAHAYKKIKFINLYPGIDMEFGFPEDTVGYKYSFIVHPGADPSQIKINYPLSQVRLNEDGNLIISSPFGDFCDHAPLTNEAVSLKAVACSFDARKSNVGFNLAPYDNTQDLIIDPWTVTPVYYGNNNAYDVDWDNAGNCYAFGGKNAPFQLIKFNSSGGVIWTYECVDFNGSIAFYGDFAVDRSTGQSYIVDGGSGKYNGAELIKINASGVKLGLYQGGTQMTEMWRVVYNKFTNKIVIGGGGVSTPSNYACYVDTNLTNISIADFFNAPKGQHDVWGLTVDGCGNAYLAVVRSRLDNDFDNVMVKIPLPSLTPATWLVNTGYNFFELSNVLYPGMIDPLTNRPKPTNGYNGMVMSNTNLYTYDGYVLKKWNSSNGALVSSTTIVSPFNDTITYGGLSADDCDNLFVGVNNTIRQYDSNMGLVNTINMPGKVVDVSLGKNGLLYSCGEGFVSTTSVTLPVCSSSIVNLTATDSITNASCTDPGSASVTVSGGTSPYTVTWNTSPVQNGFTATNLSAGTYIATIKDNACVQQTIYDTVVIVNSGRISSLDVNSAAICLGGSTTLTASGATTYTWAPGTGLNTTSGASVTANPGATTTYTVTATLSTCTDTVTSIVTVNPLPNVIVNSKTICSGNSAALSASGASTYSWSPSTGLSATTGANVFASPTANTIYTVSGTQAGCSDTATSYVTVNALPLISVNSPTICSGSSVALTASGADTYSWSPSTGLSSTSGSTVTANPSLTTTYTVIGTSNSTNCSDTAISILTVLPAFTVSANNATVCAGDSAVLAATGATTYSWAPSTGLSATIGSTVKAKPLSDLTYTVVGTTSGCKDTAYSSVTVSAIPTVLVNSTAVCVGDSALLTATGATNYSWLPTSGLSGTTGTSVRAAPVNTTTYTVTGTSSGCSDTALSIVTIYSLPTATASGNGPICENQSINLTAGGGQSYAWTGPGNYSSSSQNPVIPNATAAMSGNYIVTVTNSNNCIDSATVSMTVNPTPVVAVNSPSVCSGVPATLTATGASSYSWANSIGLSSTTGANVTANPSTTTTYTVTGTSSGCSDTATSIVTIAATPVVSVNSEDLCNGDSVLLTASGAAVYSWSPSLGLSSTSGASVYAFPTATTTYSVTGTTSGCSDTADAVITVNSLPVVSAGSNSPVCAGTALNLTSSAGVSHSWIGPSGFSSTTQNPVINNTTLASGGLYSVTVTDSNGCKAIATVNVTVDPLPSVNTTGDTVCLTQTFTIGATGGSSYSWTGPNAYSSLAQNPVITNASLIMSGDYVVTVTGSNNCVVTDTAKVLVTSALVINASDNGPVCEGDSLSLFADAGVSWNWSGPSGFSSTSQNPFVGLTTTAMAGTYTLTATGSSGCTGTDSATVIVNALPVPVAGTNSPICAGDTLNLTSSVGTSHLWSGPDSFSSGTQNPVINTTTLSSAGLYSVVVTDSNGCHAVSTVNVTIDPLPVVNISGDTVCLTQTITIGASGGTSYSWTGPNAYSSSAQNPVLTNASLIMSGDYVVTVTGSNNCVVTDTAKVLVTSALVINASDNGPVCEGDSLSLFADAGVSWIWSGPSGFSSTSQNPVIVAAATAMAGTYILTATGSSGCTGTDSATVIVNALPVPVAASNSPVCTGDTLNLTSSAGVSYSWSGVGGFSSVVQNPLINDATLSSAGLYSVIVTDTSGCSGTATVYVLVNSLPVVSVNSPSICIGDTATLIASGASTYFWSPPTDLNGITGSTVSAFPLATAPYFLVGKDTNGCSSTANLIVTVNSLPVVSVSNATICSGDAATLIAGGASVYSWSPSIGLNVATGDTVIATPAASATFMVLGTDANNCQDTATAIVIVNTSPSAVISPLNASGCVPFCLNYMNSTGTDIANCFWDFGNNQSSANCAPFNCYDQDGFYSTSLTVTDTNGCTNTAYSIVSVYPLPEADFAYGPESATTLNPEIEFTDLTLNDTILNWYWIAGDSIDSIQNPQFTFPVAGNYPVTLIVTTIHGCTDTITKNIIIEDEFAINIPNAFTPNGDGVNDVFIPKGIGINSQGYHFRIFDRWGNVVFFSDSLDKGWDGSFQTQSNSIVQRDVYVWKIELKTFKGNKKSLTGVVTLVR